MSRVATCLVLLLAVCCSYSLAIADDIEDIDKRVQDARTAFEAENEAIFGDLLKEIDAKDATERARTKPDLERIKAIKAEREEVEQGRIPASASAKFKTRIKKNTTTFSAVLLQAKTDYLKAKGDEQAEAIAAELDSLKTTGLKSLEKPSTPGKEPADEKKKTLEQPVAGNQKPSPDIKNKAWPKNAPPFAKAPFDFQQAQKVQAAWAKYLKVDAGYTNKIGMKFRLIPPGEFVMGSSPADIEEAVKSFGDDQALKSQALSEGPQHKVTLTHAIYLGVREVTQEEFQRVMGKNPATFTATGSNKQHVAGIDTATLPVDNVSWHDAAEFCSRLSAMENRSPIYFREGENTSLLNGNGYRLPSEAEWEFAARAGALTKFWTGDEFRKDIVGWQHTNRTYTGGMYAGNPFGLFDTMGNLREWTEDHWEATWYSNFTKTGAINPRCWDAGNIAHVIRGGCFADGPVHCRSSARMSSPGTMRGPAIGFRVALTVSASK